MVATISTTGPSEAVVAVSKPEQVSTGEKVGAPKQSTLTEPLNVDTKSDRAGSMEDIENAVSILAAAVQEYSPSISVGFDGELNKMVVRVVDAETNELIRELPPEEVLDIARYLERHGVEAVGSESLRGMLVDEYT